MGGGGGGGEGGGEHLTSIHPLPADAVVDEANLLHRMQPIPSETMPHLLASHTTPWLPVLPQSGKRTKPQTGLWLQQSGWEKYLKGQIPTAADFIKVSELWAYEERVGIGMNTDQRSAEEGKLFTTQSVTLHPNIGLVVTVQGANPPNHGLLRLGGDGRGASLTQTTWIPPQPDFSTLLKTQKAKLVLTTPGLFQQGAIPNGVTQVNGQWQLNLHGVKAQIVCFALPRAEIISGFDLAQHRPKLAQKAVSTGAVYWLNNLEATETSLKTFLDRGLWSDTCEDVHRRAEGFNRCALAVW